MARAAGIRALQTAGHLAYLSRQGCSRTSPREAGGQEVRPFLRALFRVETRLVSFDPLPGAPASHPSLPDTPRSMDTASPRQTEALCSPEQGPGLVAESSVSWETARSLSL